MKQPVSRLGKGLSAMISPRPAAVAAAPPAEVSDSAAGPVSIPIDRVQPNPFQPRSRFDQAALDELTQSIRTHGVIQPIVVRTVDGGGYELVAGERRWRAAQAAGLMEVPAVVRKLSDTESMELALVENLQREDLGPLERARAYDQYLKTVGGTIESLSRRLGESRANVSNYMRLLRLAPEIQAMVESQELGMGQARAITGLADAQRQLALARLTVRRNLSVRQVEELVKAPEGAAAPAIAIEQRSAEAHLADVERALSRALGLAVRLKPGRKKNTGQIVIRYGSLDEFDRLSRQLGAEGLVE